MEGTQQILLENKEKVTSCIFVMRANFLEEMTLSLAKQRVREEVRSMVSRGKGMLKDSEAGWV